MQEVKAWKVGDKLFENFTEAETYNFEQQLQKYFQKCFHNDVMLNWDLTLNTIKKNKLELMELLKQQFFGENI